MNYRDQIIDQFGENAFSHALFYKYENSLRFELSEGKRWIDQFLSAYKKSEELSNFMFEGAESFFVCLSFYAGKSFLSALSTFKNIKSCQIEIPKKYFAWHEQNPEDAEENPDVYRHFILFESSTDILSTLLWGALSLDLGIKPCPRATTYIISKKLDLIVNPYDDRGMDVISTNNELLKALYSKFNHYLLDYDRVKMESTVGIL
jgi:hypothetical protein